MKITIGKPIPPEENPKNQYKIVLDFMIGDADGEDEIEIFCSKDNTSLERFLTFLDNCEDYYKESGKGGYEDYTGVKDYYVFCNGVQKKDPNLNEFLFDWSYEGMFGTCNSLEGYTITYFDENGVEHFVTVKK